MTFMTLSQINVNKNIFLTYIVLFSTPRVAKTSNVGFTVLAESVHHKFFELTNIKQNGK